MFRFRKAVSSFRFKKPVLDGMAASSFFNKGLFINDFMLFRGGLDSPPPLDHRKSLFG